VSSCSQTIKRCGLKSTKQVADLNKVSVITITRAYSSDTAKFYRYVNKAVDILYDEAVARLNAIIMECE